MNTEYAVGNIRIHFESRARRRWFVTLCYAVFVASDLIWCFLNPKMNPNASPKEATSAWIVAGCMFLSVALVIVFTGIAGDMRARGDERETHRREHAYFRAYFVLGNFLVGALFAGYFRGPNPITPLLPQVLREFLMQLSFMLLGAAGILYVTLPQAILLWTEPDMDENPEPVTQ
jgi:hypothetical protein